MPSLVKDSVRLDFLRAGFPACGQFHPTLTMTTFFWCSPTS